MELNKEKFVVLIGVALVFTAFLVYGFLYAPLIKSLKLARLECQKLESRLHNARESLDLFPKTQAQKTFMPEQNISRAIDELTKEGKSLGISFLSMKLDKIQESADRQYRILPVVMDIESSYEVLGEFLGSLDSLKKSVTTVDNFTITQDQQLKAKLVVNMYLVSQNAK